MNMLKYICVISFLLSAFIADAEQYYTKQVVFPKDATVEEKIEMASRLVPSPRQLAWQRLELTAFLHYGMNTYTGREWGDGSENPQLFNPESLDAEQWVKTLRDAGFKLVILTAKHHDGFCLWQTKTTRHSVASSPWKNGKGDVMAELCKACNKYGMKLGVYLSPWDRNAECYGDSPRYNDMFVAQLTELLSNYGTIDEVWFDGACGEGPNGKKQVYDWTRYKSVIKRLQPNAVVAIMGDDVRWVGNEKGMGRDTEWSATALTPGIYPEAAESNKRLGIYGKAKDLGSRDIVAKAERLYWWPSEVDVSIRPGWFFQEKQQPKPLADLVTIYLNSVGKNSVLLLNIPPNKQGLINENDCVRLRELKQWVDTNFADDLVASRKGMECKLKSETNINCVLLQENIERGQRVESFEIEVHRNGEWIKVAEGTTIGNKRIVTFPACSASSVRLKILSARGETFISRISVYNIVMPQELNENSDKYRELPRMDWRVISASSANRSDAYAAIDDACSTVWKSSAGKGEKYLTVDMGKEVAVAGFVYKIRGENAEPGTISKYRFETSLDGETWTKGAVGEFGNIVNNPISQYVYLSEPVKARYFRFESVAEIEGRDFITIAELSILVPSEKLAAVDDEKAVWDNASAPLQLRPGDNHPKVKGWKFYTAHEFNEKDCIGSLPMGWRAHIRAHASRFTRIDVNKCCRVQDGYLYMGSMEEPDSIDNGFGKMVKYSSFAWRSSQPGDKDHWCNFTENMRIEVRCRRSNTIGMNDALWFMGNNNRPWPDNGEIDLLENPKRTVNHRAHFTLHSKNHYAGVVGGSGSTTATIDLADMTQWNIYWLEWYPDRIVGGVNGQAYFEHRYGDNGNTDWPWSDAEGFYMLFTSGLSVSEKAWPGKVDSSTWELGNLPHMDVDWVRVFVNDNYAGAPAPKMKFY